MRTHTSLAPFHHAASRFSANPNDRPAPRLASRCQRLAESGVPEDWNGAIQIETTSLTV